MRGTQTFDVMIIGAGITGLSTAYHLEQLGIKKVALASLATPSVSAQAAGLIMGGQVDNFTRVSHAHGSDFAAALWRFGDQAFDALVAFCKAEAIPHTCQRRVRLITSSAEHKEAQLATKQLREAGFTAALAEPRAFPELSSALKDRVLAIQDEGSRGGFVSPRALLAGLGHKLQTTRLQADRRVVDLQSAADGTTVTFADATKIHAEIVVVAAHLAIGQFVANLKSALVSVADQWQLVKSPRTSQDGAWRQGGLVFSANHTYEWGVTIDELNIHMGGGRYLRPMAGIEAEQALIESKITKHLTDQLAKTFTWGGELTAANGHAALDCRPCDELPIIGPMYGDQRVLVSTGYMGSGLTLGFLAGRCLAELIEKGRSETLPRRLWPERLRSIDS